MRIPTPTVQIRDIEMGADHPIIIQSMTNSDTADPKATAEQSMELADAGSEIVRVTVNNQEAAKAIPELRNILDQEGYQHLPIVGDFHFNGHTLLTDIPECAKTLDKFRINPGNVGFGDKHEYNFQAMIQIAKEHQKPVRIGVNWGSLDRDLLTEMMNQNSEQDNPKDPQEVIIEAVVESAIRSAESAEEYGLKQNQIVISTKMSQVQDTIAAYQLLAERMKKNQHYYALHLGLTEAGSGIQGLVSSSAALGILLQQGIGDTIRVSITPTPDEPRTKEVEVCKALLQSMEFRHFQPKVTSCPGCGRTDSTFFQELAAQVNDHIVKKMKEWRKKYPGVARMKVAVMGCVVNGPGESSHADIAISLPGKNEQKMAPVFVDGKLQKTLMGDNIPEEFIRILEDYVQKKYS